MLHGKVTIRYLWCIVEEGVVALVLVTWVEGVGESRSRGGGGWRGKGVDKGVEEKSGEEGRPIVLEARSLILLSLHGQPFTTSVTMPRSHA